MTHLNGVTIAHATFSTPPAALYTLAEAIWLMIEQYLPGELITNTGDSLFIWIRNTQVGVNRQAKSSTTQNCHITLCLNM